MDNLVPVLRGYLLTRSVPSVLWALVLAVIANGGDKAVAAEINKLATRLAAGRRKEKANA